MDEGLQLRVERVGGASCPYCRDALVEDEARTCQGCGTGLHPECLAELSRCPSLGCPTLAREFSGEEAPERGGRGGLGPALRAGLRRGLALGIPLALVVQLPLFLGSGRVHLSESFEVGLIGLLMGLIVLPASALEHVLARREPALAEHLGGAALSALGGGLISILAFAGAEFAHWIDRGLGSALEHTGRLLGSELWVNPEALASGAVAAFAIALVTFLRLRGARLSRQLAGSFLGVSAFAALLAFFVPMRGGGQVAYWLASGVGALVLPLTEWLLDAARWRAWLRRGPRKEPQDAEDAGSS